ncbi:MAG: choice-of-anchor L domain-containing protein [Flavobacteriales bacterium]
MHFRVLPALIATLLVVEVEAQLAVDVSMSPTELVQNVLLGGGVTVSNVRYNGALGLTTPQVGSGSFDGTTTNLGLAAGLILSSGEVENAVGPASEFSGDDNDTGSDPDLVTISGGAINDRAVLEFDFVPTGDSLKFRYVFASEEYPEWICSYNDVFGFFLSGPGIAGPYTNGAINIALVPNTSTPVGINNVNNGLDNDPNDPVCPAMNPQYYVDNVNGLGVSYDGFTVVLEAFALVQCGETYHIKLAVGDAGGSGGFDTTYDSAVFLEAGSFTSTGQVVPELVAGPGIIGNTMMEGCVPVELIFTRLGDLSMTENVDITVSGTATAGVDYSPPLPGQLVFPAGDSTVAFVLEVPQDADGPETMIVTIEQLVACANTSVTTVFTFNIDSPPPLVSNAQDISGTCGQVHVLDPGITGGVGYYSYLWSTGETTATITVSPEETTTYTFTVSDSCSVLPLSGSFTVSLPVLEPLAIEVSPALEVPCLASDEIEVLAVNGGNGNYTYAWSVDGVALGNTAAITVPSGPPSWYVVTVTEGCGSSVQDSVLVSMVQLDPIVINTSGDVTVICQGDPTTLEVLDITGGNGVYTLEWTNAVGEVLGSADELTVDVPADATYTISVADECGTFGDTTLRTSFPYAQFQVRTDADRTICYGDGTVLNVTVEGGSSYHTIEWVGLGWSAPSIEVGPLEETTYTVIVSDQCGEVLSDTVTIAVETVFVDINVSNEGQNSWFLQAATVPIAASFAWDMGDGTQAFDDRVAHDYLDLEDHWVELRTITRNGCEGSDAVLLSPPAHLYFPNAFSPDGDGVNETFGPIGHSISEFEMVIFDRWGEQIHVTTDINKPWDGSLRGGAKAMTGVYIYKYRAAGHYFPAVEGLGHVTLLNGSQD